MSVPEPRHPASIASSAPDPESHLNLREIAPQLREMLADDDWLPACKDLPGLHDLLHRIDTEADAGNEPTPPDVALLVAAHNDFSRFRRALAARLNAPDDKPLHITPDEWLYLRLRHPEKAANLAPYAEYRTEEGRFHIGD